MSSSTSAVQTTTTSTTASQPDQEGTGQAIRGRRHQKPRSSTRGGGHSRTARGASLALRPASVAPQAVSAQSSAGDAQTQQVSNGAAGGNQRRRGGRGGRHQTSVVETRRFGGALTNGKDTPTSSPLHAGAVEFKPGHAYAPSQAASSTPSVAGGSDSGQLSRRKRAPKQRRLSKSVAPDLPSRIHEDIDTANYECAICTSEVLRKSKVWSCHMCWTVFHLDCIKKWSNNADSGRQRQSDEPAPRQWRCPGCNLPQDVKPRDYRCWCEKEHEPRTIPGLSPHSCGQTCAKARVVPKKCPHPCELLCHAGPCPPCTHMGPTQRCFCGKESSTRRCTETHYESGWSCGNPCGDLLPCGEHTCQRECHEGLCGACEVRVDGRCYCGKEEKSILCCDRDDDMSSKRIHATDGGPTVVEEWTGNFQCTNLCDRLFDCGKHSCKEPCHASMTGVSHCPRSPDVVDHCPCGKTPLSLITNEPRTSCEDAIPKCAEVCLKQLGCDHSCPQKCHTGECAPCMQRAEIKCRCGRTASTTICHQGVEEAPQCARICRTTLNCGRHECGERCCSGERRATERQAHKRKQRPLNAPHPVDDGFEAEHICTRVCGRLLKCGNHTCEELCHKGPCSSCPEAIFDEISCHCGRTSLQPPLPCGTLPPSCRYDCERPKACGHPQVQHNCHSDNESCPKCPFLIQKQCLCGKKTLKHQQCWFSDVRCGEVCNRKLKCGSHHCLKTCHKPGECEDQVASTCKQPCGKAKKVCGHACDEECHAPFPCKEDRVCRHKILITCPCQHVKEQVRCNATSSSLGNTTKVLACTEDCARVERNRKLALALDIDPDTHSNDHIPYSTETLNILQTVDQKWATDQEREFRVFASDENERRIRFKPMPAAQRSFIHALAEDFGLDSESMDPEPHRHVAVLKTPRFVAAPSKTLRDCIRIRRMQASAAAAEKQQQALQHREAQRSNVAEEWNGFLLTNARFALTVDELENEIRAVLGPQPKVRFNVQFLASGDVGIQAKLSSHTEDAGHPSATKRLDALMKDIRLPLLRGFSAHSYGSLQLARFDESLNVLRKETDSVSGGGWSQVAAKAAAPKRTIEATESVGGRGAFTVLANLATKKKEEEARKRREAELRKQREEDVVEDWADAVDDDDDVAVKEAMLAAPSQPCDAEEGVGDASDPGIIGSEAKNKADLNLDAAEEKREPSSPQVLEADGASEATKETYGPDEGQEKEASLV